jgi:hypothetical protein
MYKYQTDCYCKEERLLFEVGNIFSSYFTEETTYLFVSMVFRRFPMMSLDNQRR